MFHRSRTILMSTLASATCVLCLVKPAPAQPTADQVLTDVGISAGDKQRILNGEFVTADIPGVSDKDLSLLIAFLVKTSPDDLSKQVMGGKIISTDPQVRASGEFSGAGSLSDLAKLQVSADAAQTLSNAKAGEKLNFSTSEIAALNAAQGQEAVQQQLRQILLARYQAYKASGLDGIAPYDRGGGSAGDVGGSLRKASESARELQKYLPAFHQVLTGFPKATAPGTQQNFYWVSYDIDGTPTFVLTHTMAAADGAVRAVVQRQYYASTGYNAEQAVAGFLPVQEGTVVVYTNHTFTDQVAGFGGSTKRSIGRRMMASKLKEMFDSARKEVAR